MSVPAPFVWRCLSGSTVAPFPHPAHRTGHVIEVKENTLTIRGNKQSSGDEESDNLIYQGITERNFERNFQLADHVQITGASLENGLLQVDLLRVVQRR